jgi:hypothetical protein
MKTKLYIMLSGLLLITSFGCTGIKIRSYTKQGKDSVNQFITRTLNEHGRKTLLPKFPELGTRWRYSIDSNGGRQIFIYDAEFSEVAEFLRLALGDPNTSLRSTDVSESIKEGFGFYTASDKGFMISYSNEENFVHVTILRPKVECRYSFLQSPPALQ